MFHDEVNIQSTTLIFISLLGIVSGQSAMIIFYNFSQRYSPWYLLQIGWCHEMETFSRYWPFCAGNSPVTGEFLSQRPMTRSFNIFFDLRLNNRLSNQSWGWWFETPLRSLWRQCNIDLGLSDVNLLQLCAHLVMHSNLRVTCWLGDPDLFDVTIYEMTEVKVLLNTRSCYIQYFCIYYYFTAA